MTEHPGYFRVTYEIVTHESAEHGEAAERGFMAPGQWRDESEPTQMTLREALRLASPDCDCGRWFAESDGREDYATGDVETRSIHPPRSITPASYARVARVILGKRT